MNNKLKLVSLYSLFAVISTFFNLLGQEVSITLYSSYYGVFISVVVGTAVGLVIKYLLDKKYIFKFKTRDVQHDSQVFILYTIMGLLTTFIFWGFEFGFDYYFQTKAYRYLGAVIGLSIGYWIKYQLDKKYVFKIVEG